jgi:hypothetical protein
MLRSGPRFGAGEAGSFECSATGVTNPPSFRATAAGLAAAGGADFVPDFGFAPAVLAASARHRSAVVSPRVEAKRTTFVFKRMSFR